MNFFVILIITINGQCPSVYDGVNERSGCWTFDITFDECRLTNPACASVTCGEDQMTGFIREDVFGQSPLPDDYELKVNGNDCAG